MDRSPVATNLIAPRKQAGGVISRFVREEDGSLLILSIFIFLTMLVMSAMTLDFMRQEEMRQRVQNTADRASLAAADLNQTLDPQDVVDNYFAADGLTDIDYSVAVQENSYGSSRTVTITSNNNLKRSFAEFVAPSIKTLPLKVHSKAEESIGKVEISLVLDVSGSMNQRPTSGSSETRIERLKPAAIAFVEQMFDVVQPEGSEEGRLMMSIVPYSTQVALSPGLADAYTLSNGYAQISPATLASSYSMYRKERCVDFHVSDFASLAINPSTELQRTMYGDSWDFARFENNVSNYKYSYNTKWDSCRDSSAIEVLPYSKSETALTAKIQGLTAEGNTSIDFGAKWGLALLDPSAKLAVTKLIAAGDVDSIFAGRPTDYGSDADTMKVMVLMTDGANTQAYSTKPEYRSGVSPIKSRVAKDTVSFNNTSTFVYYDASRGSTPYYNYSLNQWQAASNFPTGLFDVSYEALYQTNVYSPNTSKLGTYPYKPLNLFGVAYFFGLPYGRSVTQQYELMAEMSVNDLTDAQTQKDDNLHAICDLARNQGILVFTIAVDPDDSDYDYSSILSACATTASYAFAVDSSAMADAFSTIIANINALRLSN